VGNNNDRKENPMNNEVRYYDHAKNHRNAAVAHAVAKVAREVKAEGNAWVVEFPGGNGAGNWWAGGYYDALGLAKQLVRNNVAAVLTAPDGRVMGAADIAAARY
jgi:hypothetical protein